MRRFLLVCLALIVAAIALPPIWFRLVPTELPQMPPPERLVKLASGPRMHVIERGAGPAVVLVHGLPGQAGDWRVTTDLLAAQGRRVLAVDRIGFGHSDARPHDDFTYEANGRELCELLDALDLQNVTVVGWSYGGGTALTAAHQGSPRIGRLVLIGSVGPGMPGGQPPLPIRLLMSRPVLRWMRAVPPAGLWTQRMMSVDAFSGQPQPDWWLPGLAANMSQEKTFLAFVGEGERESSGPVPDTAGIDRPILVIHGDQDQLVPIAVGRALASNNPRAELIEVAGGSHMLPITHAQLLADRIAGFSAPPAPARAAPEAGAPRLRRGVYGSGLRFPAGDAGVGATSYGG